MLELITDSISSLLYPRICGSCHSSLVETGKDYACPDCWSASQISQGDESVCEKCGLVLGPNRQSNSVSCWQCDGHHYDRARALGIYSHAVAAEVVRLKSTPSLSLKARELMKQNWPAYEMNDFDLIVPVPLSKRRRFERGHNQAEVIAEYISKFTNVPVDRRSLQRSQHSPLHRIGMDRKARDLSVMNSFEVSRPKLIEGTSIVLIDDVYTTGATVSYCAKVLKKNGACKVEVFTLARAVLRY